MSEKQDDAGFPGSAVKDKSQEYGIVSRAFMRGNGRHLPIKYWHRRNIRGYAMIDGKFTAKERAYLASLPAVKSVDASHIHYANQFRLEVMCRYSMGESPSAIFREAGLDPKLIGYKRVERCIARWKQRQERDRRRAESVHDQLADCEEDLPIELQRELLPNDIKFPNSEDDAGTDADPASAEPQDVLSQLARAQLTIDRCNLLIAKQALRIDELERVLRKLVK